MTQTLYAHMNKIKIKKKKQKKKTTGWVPGKSRSIPFCLLAV
jgi:hypothetical protein